jgi:hypothetical protein
MVGTHIGPLLLVWALQDIPQNVNGRGRFDRNARQHSVVVDIANQLSRACPEL